MGRIKIRLLLAVIGFSLLFAQPAAAEDPAVQISVDQAQIQLIGSTQSDERQIKINVLAPVPGKVTLKLDDLTVFEGGFAAAAYGSQSTSLNEFLLLSDTEFSYVNANSPSEFVTIASIRSGLDKNRFARILIEFLPDDQSIPSAAFPISVVAVTEESLLPRDILINPASAITEFKVKEDNSIFRVKKFIPGIPNIIDSDSLRLVSDLTYTGENIAWGQVVYEISESLENTSINDLPGVLLLPGQTENLTLTTSQVKATGITQLPRVGLISINAYLVDPTTGEILRESVKTDRALVFPWKIPFLVIVITLIVIGLWYNFFKPSRPQIKSKNDQISIKSKVINSKLNDDNSFSSPLEFLIYLIASTADENQMGRQVARDINHKYPTARAIARASTRSLTEMLAPSSLSEYKAASLKTLANYLVENFDGQIPMDETSLNRLPGIISADLMKILEFNW